MGSAGFGKSTLMKMFSGMIPMFGGEIALFDLDIQKKCQFFKTSDWLRLSRRYC